MTVPRVKICGIRDHLDLHAALQGGADAVGFLVGQTHPSPDFIDLNLASELAASVPPFVDAVLVTHAEEIDEVVSMAKSVRIQCVQIHSDLGAGDLARIREILSPRTIIGKISVSDRSSIQRLRAIESAVDAIVLDSVNELTGQVGGTGQTHDWAISAEITRTARKPIILAGGLNWANVQAAIQLVNPTAVDVNSGVETPNGAKDLLLVRRFVTSAKGGV